MLMWRRKGNTGGAPDPARQNGATTAEEFSGDGHARVMSGKAGVFTDLDVLDAPPRTETFIPVARYALIDRLTTPAHWPNGNAAEARRFFKFLDYWRHQRYNTRLFQLTQDYEVFSPDSDLLLTRSFTAEEFASQQRRVLDAVETLLRQSNYSRIDPSHVETILSKETHYGLDLSVEMREFEEILIYYRGASNKTGERRSFVRFMRKEEFEVPIFRRLFVLFKLKPFEQRVQEVMDRMRLNRKNAEKFVRKSRCMLPSEMNEGSIYIKLFKNMPRSDIEMAFPNTQIRFRVRDKFKLGLTSGAGIGMGIAGLIGKIGALSNPFTAVPALAGFGGVVFRQFMSFMNQRQRYMVVMAQNLYFHALADNHSAIVTLCDSAAREDVKEEVLLYAELVKKPVHRNDLKQVDAAIERYLRETFGIEVDFDYSDALGRLIEEGIVIEGEDGMLRALPPQQAALHLDTKWDLILDMIPDVKPHEGREVELPTDGARQPAPQAPERSHSS